MDCLSHSGVKQGTSFHLSVIFDSDVDDFMDSVESIEFIFKQRNESSATVLKTALYTRDGTGDSSRVENTNIILVPFSIDETYLFEKNRTFYMDTRIHKTDSSDNPSTNIVGIIMNNTLFDEG